MQLCDILIENFRGIRSLSLQIDDLTVLIGENNTGKTTILEAIRLVLARGFGTRRDSQFAEYDFHLQNSDATPQTADPISIILHFAERPESEWPDEVLQQISEVIHIEDNGRRHVWLQAKGYFQPISGDFESKVVFLNSNKEELLLKNVSLFNTISRLVPVFFLSALRDASQEFGPRGQFWSGFLKSVHFPADQRHEIEDMLRKVNASIIDANAGLAEVTKNIADTGRLIPLEAADPVVLEAVPTRLFDMAIRIQVFLKSINSIKLPLHRHGEGTQNIAILMLFQAYIEKILSENYAPESTPILALEEPEAHLHPSAIRSLGSFLQTISVQRIVSSHSGDLVARIPITALRRLYKINGETKIGQVEPNFFEPSELEAINYRIWLDKGHFLFSHCWLLVEGESEFRLMSMLFGILGYSQDKINFSIL
jgi:putative ATP-dependent endonuclease of OLD family